MARFTEPAAGGVIAAARRGGAVERQSCEALRERLLAGLWQAAAAAQG